MNSLAGADVVAERVSAEAPDDPRFSTCERHQQCSARSSPPHLTGRAVRDRLCVRSRTRSPSWRRRSSDRRTRTGRSRPGLVLLVELQGNTVRLDTCQDIRSLHQALVFSDCSPHRSAVRPLHTGQAWQRADDCDEVPAGVLCGVLHALKTPCSQIVSEGAEECCSGLNPATEVLRSADACSGLLVPVATNRATGVPEHRLAVVLLCGYNLMMNVASSRVEVGIRDLKNSLSRYIERVRQGEEVIVTDRGRPVARLSSLDQSSDWLAELVASGAVRPPKHVGRHRPERRIKSKGSVSDLVAEQRR